jgi:hypothetical protein
MNRLARLVLLCLLAVALPLQGYAAGSMRFCATMHPAQQRSTAADANAAHGHAPAAHAAAHEGAGDHASAAHSHGMADRAVQADEPVKNIAAVAGGTCSVCAACSAAALPAMPLPRLADAPEDRFDFPRLEPYAGTTPGGVERPPRSILA